MIGAGATWSRFARAASSAGALLTLIGMLSGCGALLGGALGGSAPERTLYVLDAPDCKAADAAPGTGRPELLVADPLASSLINSQRILFGRSDGTRGAYQLAAWTEPPPRRLALLMIERLDCSGLFSAVTRKSTLTGARFLLNSEIVEFYHDISVTPGETHLVVRVELVDLLGRRIVAERTFEEKAAAASYDANGAIEGMRGISARFLEELTEWLRQIDWSTQDDRPRSQ